MSNWIKVRTGLINHPKVVRIVSALCPHDVRIVSASCPHDVRMMSTVIGAIVRIWCMADMHADGERLSGMSIEALDMMVGVPGFGQAMVDVGWLADDGNSLQLPNYEEHNGATAKRRAADQTRKKGVRKLSASCPQSVRTDADEMRTRERVRVRKEDTSVSSPPPPKPIKEKFDPESAELPFGSDEFARAWVGWCRHRGEIKKPLTPQATTEQIAKLSAMGEDRAITAIRHSIAGGWQGLFEPDGYRGGGLFAKPTALEKARESADLLAAGKSSIANSIVARLQQIDAEKEARNGVA